MRNKELMIIKLLKKSNRYRNTKKILQINNKKIKHIHNSNKYNNKQNKKIIKIKKLIKIKIKIKDKWIQRRKKKIKIMKFQLRILKCKIFKRKKNQIKKINKIQLRIILLRK